MNTPKTVALVDLGYLYRRNWHAQASEDMSAALESTLGWCAKELGEYDLVAVCRDRPPYKRTKIFPGYKGDREAPDQVMIDQYHRTIAALERWGYTVVGVEGYEADDVIATLAGAAAAAGHEVDIYSADKDLAQCLTSEKVMLIDPGTGEPLDMERWAKKFGGMVPPSKIPTWLALVGDSSDSLPGIKGVGPKTAAKWLESYEDATDIVAHYNRPDSPISDRFQALLDDPEIRKQLQDVELLATVVTDLPLDVGMLQAPCSPVAAAPAVAFDDEDRGATVDPLVALKDCADVIENDLEMPRVAVPEVRQAREVLATTQAMVPATPSWERQLEPANSGNAWKLAQILHDSQLYSQKFKSPNQILAVMLEGRARGMDATTALRNFNVIKGKVAPSSEMLIALVKNSPACIYFRLVEGTDRQATWETQRKGYPSPDRLTFTFEEAEKAGYTATRSGPGSWQKIPKTMLRWRAATELARMVYPDVCAGMYAIEEVGDFDG